MRHTAACCFHSGWPVKGRVRQVGFGAKISAFSHANREKKHLTRKHITKTESVKREEAQENREGHGMSVVSTQQGGEPA